MKKTLIAVLIACVSAFTVACLAGCACSSEVSRSSDKDLVIESESAEEVSTDPAYFLIVGNDSRYQTSEDPGVNSDDPSYGDTIMLLRADPATNVISILSIPRDTGVDIDGTPEKINAVHAIGGPEALADKVGEMFGVDVPYYVDMKFIDFANFIDKLGGVTVDVPMGLTGGDIINGDSITLDAGTNTLDGVSALMLARQRKVYSSNGEAVRQMISREMVASVIQAVADQPSSEASNYASILESIGETNLTDAELEAYVAAFMDNEAPITFNLGTSPYDGDIDESGMWRIPNDPEVLAQITAAMENETALDVVTPEEVY